MAVAVSSVMILSPLAATAGVSERDGQRSQQKPESADLHRTSTSLASRSETCRDARRAIRFYAAHEASSRRQMHEHPAARSWPPDRGACEYVRWLLDKAIARARRARAELERWLYDFAWWRWLPDKWQRLGACETGYGHRPGNWHHANGRFVSAFGISRQAYDEDARVYGAPPWNDRRNPTPREQYLAALGHYHLHGGFSGWGCRGA